MKPDPIKHSIDGVDVSLNPIGEHYGLETSTFLENFWVCQIDKSVILTSAAIDTKSKAEKFLHEATKIHQEKEIKPPPKFAVYQLNTPSTDWDLVATEHILLQWLSHLYPVADLFSHVNLPVDPFFSPHFGEPKSEFYLKAVAQLPFLQNVEAWEKYCFWLAADVEHILEKIPLEAMDTYTLEAALKDFVHEVRAVLLRNYEQDIDENILKIGALNRLIPFPITPVEDIVHLEKQLIKARLRASESLKIQLQILKEITRVTKIIEKAHPELVSLERKTLLLSHLIERHLLQPPLEKTWKQDIMIAHLLHEEMDIVTAINDEIGLGRTLFILAVLIGLSALKQHYSWSTVTDLLLNWEKINHLTCDPQGQIAERLRQNILRALILFSIPMAKASAKKIVEPDIPLAENADFLKFLPVSGNVLGKEGHWIHAHLVNIDKSTGQPSSLTKAGHHLLTQL